MICVTCQTTLPDEAVACWKCGSPTRGGTHAEAGAAAPTATPVSSQSPLEPPSPAASQSPSAQLLPVPGSSAVAPPAIPPTPVAPQPADTPQQKGAHDLLLFILTFVGNAAFFICAGWSVPFAIWGNILTTAKQNPEWASVIDVVSGVALVLSGLVFFLGCWLGSYWVILRLINPSPVPESR